MIQAAIALLIGAGIAGAAIPAPAGSASTADPGAPSADLGLQATVAGAVRDAKTGEPLQGAWVAIVELERAVLTDAEGRYEIPRVPAGPHHIVIRFVGYAQRTLHALVPASGRLGIDVALEPKPHRIQTVDIRAPMALRGLEDADSVVFPDREASIAAIRNHPLLTEPDVIQALGGGDAVLRPEEPSGLHVRGGAADQTAYLIDGIPIFNPYHAAGLSSAWNPDAVSSLDLTFSPRAVEHPHALAGTVNAATRAPGDRVRGQGSVSTTQARLTVDGPIGGGGTGYVVSLRSGFAGLVPKKDESSHLKGETGDALAKLEMAALGGRARLLGYIGGNEIDAASIVVTEEAADRAAPRNTFAWESRSIGLEWRRTVGTTSVRLLGWGAQGDAESHWAALAGPSRMTTERRDAGLLAAIERRTARATAAAGLRVERSASWYRVEFDSVGVPDSKIDAKAPIATGAARYARRLGPGAEIDVGLSLAETGGEFYPAIRASGLWRAAGRLTFSGGYARTHQFQQSLRNPESVVGTVFPVDLHIGSDAPDVPVARCDQAWVALDYRPMPGARLTAQAYARDSDGLLLVAPGEPEPFATGAFTTGSSPSRGITLEAALAAARYGVAASYGYQDVRVEHGGAGYVPEHGARHLLEGGVTAFPMASLSVRIGAAAGWGRRTTIATGEFEWESCNLLDQGCEFSGSPHYVGDPLGGAALPTYVRVDFGVRKHWHVGAWGEDVSFALFGAVTNVFGRGNVLTYSRDPSSGVVTEVDMRPRSPLVVGLDWWF